MALASALITQARYQLVDIDDTAYSDNAMLSFLNEASDRFASETHCNQAVIDKTTTTNKITFAELLTVLTAAVGKQILIPAKVELTVAAGNQFLPKAPFSEMKDKLPVATTTPTRWSPFAETIYFDLDPSVSGSNAVSVYCSYVPATLSGVGSTVLIPSQWHPALVKYMIFCARLADRDAGLANGAFAEYEIIRTRASEFYAIMMES